VPPCGGVEAPIAAQRREDLIDASRRARSVRELFGAASDRLRGLVPFDAANWVGTDPATNLPTAPSRSENLSHFGGRAACLRVWECEFLVDDVNSYGELARSAVPAAGLRLATHDRPARSARYREFVSPNGFGDELRAVLRVGGSSWAALSLYREHGRPAFSESETELVASLSAPLAAAVRDHARSVLEPRGAADGPGLMVFSPAGELISFNDEALAWLDELPAERNELPIAVIGMLVCARAVAEGRQRRTARARIRSSAGRWLVCHASCLRGPDGEIGETALVIEPAKASEIAPIIVQAYELSGREREISRLIARGVGTAEIAGRLHLSVHTVRDHVKAIFEKVGVSSRGELVAKLFAEHYAPVHFAPGGYESV
jgi:DNA-binding CsgD family transcriptional regulator